MKRVRSHKIESLSDAFLETFFVDWICNKLDNDYGLDYNIIITENEVSTELNFFVQNKGTDSINISENYVKYSIETKYLDYYSNFIQPILINRYDAQNNCGYWINIQKYIREILDKEKPNWRDQETVTINIPITNQFTDITIIKNEIITSLKENGRIFVNKLNWFEGYEKILGNPEELENVIEKREIDNIRARLHTSILYFRKDNLEKMQEQYVKVYRQKNENEEQLKAILGLITSSNILDFANIPNLVPIAEEGQKLAESLGMDLYKNIFIFFTNIFLYINIIYEKLPIIGMKSEAAKYGSSIDDFVNFIWDSQISLFTFALEEKMTNILNILNELLMNNFIFEFIYLHLTLILVGNFVNFTSLVYIDKTTITETLEGQKPLIKMILEVIEKMNDNELRLYANFCVGGYFELIDADKAREIYNKGLELAKEIDHKFYIRKFEYLLSDIGSIPQKISPNEMRNFPISETMQLIREFYFRDIDAIPDNRIKEAMKIALRDVDPTEFIKYCEFLMVDYHQSHLGKVLGLYSLGGKILTCIKKEIWFESANLELIFNHFKNEICKDCEFKSPRGDDWQATFGYLDEMKLKIFEIIRKKQQSGINQPI